ncbi:MerC family mercury resistance protein [Flavobacterium sp. j3]|uniref:MerC family mercury resistance protein n=1 Tax=Flavobacterium aureirubrum TaxID=3133147 RepID=A0ABU9N3N5_9FLAO
MKHTTQKLYDFLGISSATLCLVHCLFVPFLAILPLSTFKSIWIDILFCSIALLATSKIIMSPCTKTVKLILGISISIILVSVMIEIILHTHFEGMLLGGIGLIIGHGLNYKNHKH